MSNQSSLDQGEQQMKEKQVDLVAENSQVEPTLAPPPSIAPSSSSSLLPPTSHDPSRLNIAPKGSSFSVDPVAAHIARLFSLVGRLSSEKEALRAQVEVHSSKFDDQAALNARLSAENEELRWRKEEMLKTMEEMSKAFGSHRVWEAGRGEREGGKGRWTWSEEKYKSTSLQVARSKPPPSLDSIPVELFSSIASLLDLPDHLSLCGVSFSILRLASTFLYDPQVFLNSKMAASFVGARTSNLNPSSSRVSSLLLPRNLNLVTYHFNPSHLRSLVSHPPIAIHTVSVVTNSSVPLASWSPLLALLDPRMFTIASTTGKRDTAPTVLRITENGLPFLPRWTRLERFVAGGFSSVPILSDGTFALSSCLRRCNSGRDPLLFLTSFFDDERDFEDEAIAGDAISMVLGREVAPDPARSIRVFTAGLVEDEHWGGAFSTAEETTS